jgi:hypothetical protein
VIRKADYGTLLIRNNNMIPESPLMVEVHSIEAVARKPKTYKLDPRLISALEALAESEGWSTGSYVEAVLWKHCQGKGAIAIGEEPPIDARGGKRANAGRKPTKEEA